MFRFSVQNTEMSAKKTYASLICGKSITPLEVIVGRREVYTPVEYTPELGGSPPPPLPPGLGGGYSSSVHLGFPPNSRKTATFPPSPLLTDDHCHPHPKAERHSLIYIEENLF